MEADTKDSSEEANIVVEAVSYFCKTVIMRGNLKMDCLRGKEFMFIVMGTSSKESLKRVSGMVQEHTFRD